MATLKQKMVLKKITENAGMPLGRAMREAGYAEESAKTPASLTKSKGWAELVEEFLPDSKILKVVDEGLAAEKQNGTKREADHGTRARFAELSLKVKGRLIEKQEVSGPDGAPQKLTFEIIEHREHGQKNSSSYPELPSSENDI